MGLSMNQNLNFLCEAKLSLNQSSKNGAPSGKIEARVTSWGAREGADGRKFNYQPEGFMEWANSFTEAGKPLPMFLNHNDMGMPIGQWNEFTFDKTGLVANGELFMNTTAGSDIYEVLKSSPNLFGGVSVGAYAEEARFVNEAGDEVDDDDTDEAYFQITKGGLREVSVVMFPNNPAAEIQKLECFDAEGHLNPRIVEEALREAGLSKKGATTASSVFKKILELRDANKEIVKETPQPSELEAVVNEADTILKALEHRELVKALTKRIK